LANIGQQIVQHSVVESGWIVEVPFHSSGQLLKAKRRRKEQEGNEEVHSLFSVERFKNVSNDAIHSIIFAKHLQYWQCTAAVQQMPLPHDSHTRMIKYECMIIYASSFHVRPGIFHVP